MSRDQKQLKRVILEMGTGNALHSKDYTKAAKRAVEDAIHHSSLTVFRSLGIDPSSMVIELNLAAQEPGKLTSKPWPQPFPLARLGRRQ